MLAWAEAPPSVSKCLLWPLACPALSAAEEQRQVIWGIVLSNNGGDMLLGEEGGAGDAEAAEGQQQQQQQQQTGVEVEQQEEQELEAEALLLQQPQHQPDGL